MNLKDEIYAYISRLAAANKRDEVRVVYEKLRNSSRNPLPILVNKHEVAPTIDLAVRMVDVVFGNDRAAYIAWLKRWFPDAFETYNALNEAADQEALTRGLLTHHVHPRTFLTSFIAFHADGLKGFDPRPTPQSSPHHSQIAVDEEPSLPTASPAWSASSPDVNSTHRPRGARIR